MKCNKIIKSAILIFTIFLTFFISVNKIDVLAGENNTVYLGGYVAGFTVNGKGATVVGVCDVITEKGAISPCKLAGIEVGDTILSLNGVEVNSSKDVQNFLNGYKEGFIVTEIDRCGTKKLIDLFPERDIITNLYKLGIFIRDELSGLGTVTFLDNNGNFASLGHQVSNESGGLLSVANGNTYACTIIGVNRATKGKAGELKGMFIGDKPTGVITKNTSVGLYGKLNEFNPLNYQKIEVGKARMGSASVYTTVDGVTPKKYDIEIIKTDYKESSNKNLVIKITDKELLKQTGGILQGMSGSPIIQDGKLVGAVTHVFLNDSSRGYGINIENMLNNL